MFDIGRLKIGGPVLNVNIYIELMEEREGEQKGGGMDSGAHMDNKQRAGGL